MPNYHVTLRGADRDAMADLVRIHRLRVYPQTLNEQTEGSTVDAIADETTIQRLLDAGYEVERHEDVDEDAKESLRYVGEGNRFQDRAEEQDVQ